MTYICIMFITVFLSMHTSIARCDETTKDESVVKPARSEFQEYLDWLPSASETLVVLRETYRIPANPPTDLSLDSDAAFHEMYLQQMFEGSSREVLVSKRIKLWIQAASKFRLPNFPNDLRNIQLVGVNQHYDGCHVLVFDNDAAPDTTELFRLLLQRHPDPQSFIPVAWKHRVLGHDVVAYSASPPDRNLGAKETTEDSDRIAGVLSVRYWITAPFENILIVATSRDVLEETLRKIKKPNKSAFPNTLAEWKFIDSSMPIWGMRHFYADPDVADISDIRNRKGHALSGMCFEIDSQTRTAKLMFLYCVPKTVDWVFRSVRLYVDPAASEHVDADGNVTIGLNWDEESEKNAQRIINGLHFWLLSNLGHAVII